MLKRAALAVTHVVHAADYPTTVQNIADLVAYWRFETATQADSSVGGYTGTFIGNAAVGGAGSRPTLIGIADNRSVLLDGAGHGVTTNLTDVNFSAAGTIVAWIWQDVLASDVRRILYICGRSQHEGRAEFWVVLDPGLEITIGDRVWVAAPNEEIVVPRQAAHRARNVGTAPARFMEIWIGRSTEDDIVRLSDDYDRK